MRARTAFILLAVATVLLWRAPAKQLSAAVGGESPFRYTGDGSLVVADPSTGESVSIMYRTSDGLYEDAALDAIDHTLRCHGKGEEFPISLKLIELVDNIQDHFGARKAMVVSGYRSPEYNAALKRKLSRVAHNSLHMQGLAMDIQLPGVTKARLTAYARSLKAGGVGDYTGSNFVHIDVGPVRNW
ncbi:MAG: DUF882 domain-containing protein [bacterium]